jgi:hypothetical protein
LAPSYLFSIMSMKMVSNKAICKPKFLGHGNSRMVCSLWRLWIHLHSLVIRLSSHNET